MNVSVYGEVEMQFPIVVSSDFDLSQILSRNGRVNPDVLRGYIVDVLNQREQTVGIDKNFWEYPADYTMSSEGSWGYRFNYLQDCKEIEGGCLFNVNMTYAYQPLGGVDLNGTVEGDAPYATELLNEMFKEAEQLARSIYDDPDRDYRFEAMEVNVTINGVDRTFDHENDLTTNFDDFVKKVSGKAKSTKDKNDVER